MAAKELFEIPKIFAGAGQTVIKALRTAKRNTSMESGRLILGTCVDTPRSNTGQIDTICYGTSPYPRHYQAVTGPVHTGCKHNIPIIEFVLSDTFEICMEPRSRSPRSSNSLRYSGYPLAQKKIGGCFCTDFA